MKTLEQQLSIYAAYHRDRRNIGLVMAAFLAKAGPTHGGRPRTAAAP
jgi:hypothetical protein